MCIHHTTHVIHHTTHMSQTTRMNARAHIEMQTHKNGICYHRTHLNHHRTRVSHNTYECARTHVPFLIANTAKAPMCPPVCCSVLQ